MPPRTGPIIRRTPVARRTRRRRTALSRAMHPGPGREPTPSPLAGPTARKRQRRRITRRSATSVLDRALRGITTRQYQGDQAEALRQSMLYPRLGGAEQRADIGSLLSQIPDEAGGVFGTGIGPDIGAIDIDESAVTKGIVPVPDFLRHPAAEFSTPDLLKTPKKLSLLDIASLGVGGGAGAAGRLGGRVVGRVAAGRAANVAAVRAAAARAISTRAAERQAAKAGRADAAKVAAAEARVGGNSPLLAERAAAAAEARLSAAAANATLSQRAGAALAARAAQRRGLGARVAGTGRRGGTAKPGVIRGAGSGTGIGGAAAASPTLLAAGGTEPNLGQTPQIPVQLGVAAVSDPKQFAASSGKTLFETLVGLPGFVVMSGEAAAQAAASGGANTEKLDAMIQMIADDYAHRYGPIFEGNYEEFRKRALQTGITPFALDALIAAPTLGRAAGAAARRGALGQGAQRLATAERPRLLTGAGEVPEGERHALPPTSKERRVSRSLLGAGIQKGISDPLARRRTAAKAKHGDATAVEAQARGQVIRPRWKYALARDVGGMYARGRLSMRQVMAASILRRVLREGARLTKNERRGIFEAVVYKARTPEEGKTVVQARIDRIKRERAENKEKFPEGWDELPELEWIARNSEKVFTEDLAAFARTQTDRGEKLAELDPAITQERAALRRVKPTAQLLGVSKFKLVHTPSKQAATSDYGVKAYNRALKAAREGERGFMLSPLRKAELKDLHLFLSEDSKTGGWIKTHPDGTREMGGLFNAGGYKGAGEALLSLAERNGVTKLDVLDVPGGPRAMFERHGWYEVGRKSGDGQPDVVHMERRAEQRVGERRKSDKGPPEGRAERRKADRRQAMLEPLANVAEINRQMAAKPGETPKAPFKEADVAFYLSVWKKDKPPAAPIEASLKAAYAEAERRFKSTVGEKAHAHLAEQAAKRGLKPEEAGLIAQKSVEAGPKQNLPGVRGETTAEYMNRTMAQLGKLYKHKDVDLDLPGYFAEQVKQPGKAYATYALGGQKSVADAHAYHGTLNRLGIVDRRLYALSEGQARNIKRAFNWNFVADTFERHTFKWSRNKTLFGLMKAVEQKGIKSGYVFVNMGKIRGAQARAVDVDAEVLRKAGAEGIGEAVDDTGGMGAVLSENVKTIEEMRELGRMSDNPDQFMQQKGWALMPEAVYRELQAGAKQSLLGRTAAIATIKQSRVLLGSLNLPWLQFQIMSNSGLSALGGTGPLDIVKSVAWFRGLSDATKKAIEPYIGVGHFADTVGDQRLGKATTNHFVNSYQGLKETVGGRVIWAGQKHYAQVRDLNPMDLMFRADNAQNNFFRRAVFYSQLKRQAYESMGGRMKAIGQGQVGLIESVLKAGPTEQMAQLAKNVQNVERHAQHVADFLGDYQTFTHVERDYFKRNVMFYSFLRFSTRFAFYTMPVKHPVMTGLLGNMSRMSAEEVHDLLGGHQLPFGLGRIYFDKGKMVVDLSRANPVMSALTQGGGAGGLTGKIQGLSGLAPPLYGAIISQLWNIETFTGKPLLVEGSPSPLKYLGLKLETRGRILLNDALQLYFPYRAAEDLIYKGQQPGADSLVFDPRTVEYVDKEIKRSQRQVSASYPDSLLGGAAKAVFPYMPRPSHDIEIAKSLRERIAEERKARYGRGGSATGGFSGYGSKSSSSGGFNGY